MTYIILAAGKGTKLRPLTLKYSKTQYKLDTKTTILQRMVRMIRKYDKHAEVAVVVGYKADDVRKELEFENVKFIFNPFYEVTGSVASLWFARDYLERENAVILNGDIVLDETLIRDYVCQITTRPYVLADSSSRESGRYYIQANEKRVLVLSKDLDERYGEYCHVTKLDAVSARLLKREVDNMVCEEMYDQNYESALVQMIFSSGFYLYYKDIAGKSWVEIERVDDMIRAQQIHRGTI